MSRLDKTAVSGQNIRTLLVLASEPHTLSVSEHRKCTGCGGNGACFPQQTQVFLTECWDIFLPPLWRPETIFLTRYGGFFSCCFCGERRYFNTKHSLGSSSTLLYFRSTWCNAHHAGFYWDCTGLCSMWGLFAEGAAHLGTCARANASTNRSHRGPLSLKSGDH